MRTKNVFTIIYIHLYIYLYTGLPTEWDSKDDPKLLISELNLVFWWYICEFWSTRNPECKKTDETNSLQLSLKSHPFWVTLYVSRETDIYRWYVCRMTFQNVVCHLCIFKIDGDIKLHLKNFRRYLIIRIRTVVVSPTKIWRRKNGKPHFRIPETSWIHN